MQFFTPIFVLEGKIGTCFQWLHFQKHLWPPWR